MSKNLLATLVRSVLLALICSCGISHAQDVKRMDQVVQSYVDQNQFIGSVLVAKGGHVLLSKGYGAADLEWSIPNSPETKFRLGSITKQFTAASVLLLQDRGKLKVSDPVGVYLPDAPAAWSKITIFHLLTHSSGIPNFTGFAEYRSLKPFPKTPEQIIHLFSDKPLDFAPGEKFSYSNFGYIVLGRVIEVVSGQNYESFVQANIFTPLGMANSGYDSNTAVIVRRAAGYTKRTPDGSLAHADFIHMSIPFSAGALYSTTQDLLLWQQGLYGGKLLSTQSLQAMTTPYKDGYAMGLVVQGDGGARRISHGGGIEGFSTMLGFEPDCQCSVVVLSNLQEGSSQALAVKLANVLHGDAVVLPSERHEVSVSPADLSARVGAYQFSPGVLFRIKVEGDHLTARLGGQPWVRQYAESADRHFAKVVDADIEFRKDKAGTIDALVLHQNGHAMLMPRVNDSAPLFGKLAVYLRGSMNDWGLRDQMQQLDPEKFTASVALAKGRHEFKIGSEDFQTIDFGAAAGDESVAIGQVKTLEVLGLNLAVEAPNAGVYTFTVNVANPLAPNVTVKGP